MNNKKYNAVIVFLIRLLVFAIPIVLLHIWAAYKAGGKIDSYYARLITPKQTSLVIGTSRAEQGIVPSIFNLKMTKAGKKTNLYNYAFDLFVTPFGKSYFQSIQKKLDTSSHNGLFLICVDPWAISIEKWNADNDAGQEENSKQSPLYVSNINRSPNLEYLMRHYNKGWGSILINEYSHHVREMINKDGWLEVTVNMDATVNAQRTYNRVNIYRNEYATKYKFSTSRFSYLVSTIQYLKNYGNVILIRLPISKDIYEIEQNYMPDFESRMDSLTINLKIPLLAYADTGDKYVFIDGNHMYKESALKFTNLLVADIISKKLMH